MDNFVQPKKIMSPFSGEWSAPQLKKLDYGDKIVTEAYWYCPKTGAFISKGVVSVEPKQAPTKDK